MSLCRRLNIFTSKKNMAPVTAASVISSAATRERQKCQRSPPPKNFKRESRRLKTFANWPVTFLNGKDLAKIGFYYTNIDDVIKCAFCKTQIGFWEKGDDPSKDHLQLSPNCPFLMNEPCGNIPLTDETGDNEDEDEDEPVSQDVCGIYSLEIRPFSEPERPNKGAFSIDCTNLLKDFEELGVSKTYEPAAPHFATYASRIKTFDKWSRHDVQSPEKLAEAGFYYIGHDDNVLCFHCGGGLKSWEKNEDPWVEHARWFSKCGFVFLQKGRDFINEVVLRNKAYLSADTVREILNRSKANQESTSSGIKLSSDTIKKLEGRQPTDDGESSTSTSTSSSSSSLLSEPVSNGPANASKSLQSEDGEFQMCRICYTRERGIVFLPCGHLVCCPQCTSSLTKCIVCREPFKATVRAYLS